MSTVARKTKDRSSQVDTASPAKSVQVNSSAGTWFNALGDYWPEWVFMASVLGGGVVMCLMVLKA